MVDHDLRTLDAIVEAYKQDQRRIRGLRETTLQSYERVIRPFLRTTLGEDPLDLTRLMPPDVVKFVTSLQDRYAASSITQTSTALRSLFRFLRMKGYCDEKLELSVPTVARWGLASLPRCLDEQQLKQVLEGFDPFASKPKIGCWTSWKGSDYAQLELRWLRSGKGAAENTPHSPDVRIDAVSWRVCPEQSVPCARDASQAGQGRQAPRTGRFGRAHASRTSGINDLSAASQACVQHRHRDLSGLRRGGQNHRVYRRPNRH